MLKSEITGARYEAFVLWGHGLDYLNNILAVIDEEFTILNVYKYKPKSLKNFVKRVYSCDYVPYCHLIAKTQYLLKVPSEVIVVTVLNEKPCVEICGEDDFQHEECIRIKEIKEGIRDRYNPRIAEKRTEKHVIHGTDNEEQVDVILKLIGKKEGLAMYYRLNLQLPFKYYSKYIDSMSIFEVNINNLVCNLFFMKNNKVEVRHNLCLEDTPHWLFLNGSEDVYKNYIDNFLGKGLNSYHSVEKFKKLNLEYKGENLIVVHKTNHKFLILDGLHRATILKKRGYKFCKVIELK